MNGQPAIRRGGGRREGEGEGGNEEKKAEEGREGGNESREEGREGGELRIMQLNCNKSTNVMQGIMEIGGGRAFSPSKNHG